MPIAKGSPWGEPGSLPEGGIVVHSDAEAREVLEAARRENRPFPALGLAGGDLCRTLGGGGFVHGGGASFSVDLGEALLDGRLHLFVAHLVVHDRLWRTAFAAMNAQWRGDWNLAPRAHPNDALLDVYDARLSLSDRLRVRRRLPQGTHVPHPDIKERRVPAVQVAFARPLAVELDGAPCGSARNISVRLEPDALTVVI